LAVELAGEVALEATADLGGGFAFGSAAFEVGAGLLAATHAGLDDVV
jgi:hypothetical protein